MLFLCKNGSTQQVTWKDCIWLSLHVHTVKEILSELDLGIRKGVIFFHFGEMVLFNLVK